MNLLCGSFAVVAALMYNDLTLAFWLIVAGIVFDFFDGFVARLLHSPSAIGVQLDSLAHKRNRRTRQYRTTRVFSLH